MIDERKLFTQQTDELLTVLNRQRHDWLNHVQVLLGYLRLGRPEEGEAYLKRVSELAMQESLLARLNCSMLSVFFLTFNALHKDMLMEVDVCTEVDLARAVLDQEALFHMVSGIVCTLNEHLERNQFEPASIQITLFQGDGGIHFRFDLAGKIHASGAAVMEKLVRDGMASTVSVAEWLHTDEEWILELVVPVVEG
ncbi:sporulation initiation phosphotransferase B [Brevibacillus ruminantium]|uniref:Sporulation initiation phosphotransferase B n=1 Tax=Brevibacillus ruminantium TaxID=2950604 RepID=A0ABY4WAC7_9BACL|nr:Spo0B domain-containing protein [Brevibacillus ruminantium]USG64123.1 sporulation initiation phosphotransferase B [Brevibacillus ruminantium]